MNFAREMVRDGGVSEGCFVSIT